MPITRTNITLGDATTEPSVAWENEIKNGINNLKDNAVDTTDGNINATSITAGAASGSGDAGNRSLIFKVTDTIQKILRWDNTAGWMKLLNQAGALLPLAVADPTDATHAMTLGYFNVTRLFPKGYISGPAPVYASASSVTFKTGLRARNSANNADIELTGDVTVSLASSGAAGLDTGAEASSTWHYFYLIRKSSDGTCSVVASVTNEWVSGSITYPSGYDQKRQLPFAVRNDGSSNIIPFYCVGGWGALRVMYDVSFSDCNLNTLGTTNVVNANTSTSFVSYSCASFIPPISRAGVFQSGVSSASFVRVRPAGASHQGVAVNGNVGVNSGSFECRTNNLQEIEVAELTATGATNRIDVVGYIVTEVQ